MISNHRYFQDRPLTHPDATNEHLIMWIFEDYLKKTFWKFVQVLKILSDDPVVHVRHRMLAFIAELMSSKPEQENTLLEMLVNKMVRNLQDYYLPHESYQVTYTSLTIKFFYVTNGIGR